MGANMLNQKGVVSGPASIETLESRRLLSASPLSHALPALVETHAVKVKKTIPAVAGTTYVATVKSLGRTFSVDFLFSTESVEGALTGDVFSYSAGVAIWPCTGTVTLARAVTFHTKAGAPSLHLTAKFSADLSKLTGRVFLHGPHTAATPFSATRYAPI